MSKCYVGRCPKCKCVVAAVVAMPGREKEMAKDIAKFIHEGLAIEPMDAEQVRVTFQSCRCIKDKQAELFAAVRGSQS